MTPLKKGRNAAQTKQKILNAAIKEFTQKGLDGGRINTIAKLSGANKYMIYYHYGNKEKLFIAVVEHLYVSFKETEKLLDLNNLDPKASLQKLVEFTWHYYLQNPDFLTIVNNQNLHKAKHLKKSEIARNMHGQSVDRIASILDEGIKKGIFREDVNPQQLHLTIAGICYYYIANRHTLSYLLDDNLLSPENLEERLDFNIKTIMRMVLLNP